VDESGTFYQTSDWTGPLLYFPADRRFDIVHGLGSKDLSIDVYLSFREEGNPDSGISAAPSAGDQAVIEQVTEEIVRVHNDTCAEFYLRVTARAPNAGAAADAGGD
jgi:hypothetical protein